jgi:septal ring factor EnvC (AmiA/AmiB activator)
MAPEGVERSIDQDISNLIAKVDSRTTTVGGQMTKVAIDVDHIHIFDKDTEVTIVARSEENKADILAVKQRKVAEAIAAAEENARKLAEEEAKLAAENEKKRAKMEKKLAKKNKIEEAPVEEAPVEEAPADDAE